MQDAGIAIELKNFRNIEVDGGDSLFLLNGTTCAWAITEVHGLHLHDFSVDWDTSPFSQGVVIDVASDAKSVLVRLEGEGPVNTQFFSFRVFEKDSHLPRLIRSDRDKVPIPIDLAALGGRIVRLGFDRIVDLSIGTPVAVLHTRQSNGIIFGQCSDIELRGIHLHTAPGFAFAGTGVLNLTMDGCSVAPPAGSKRLISSTADGFHFWGSRGKFRITRTTFAGVGDDCMNVHGFLLRARRSDDNKLVLSQSNTINGRNRAISEPMLPTTGDHLEILDQENLEPLGGEIVDTVSRTDGNVEVKLKPPVILGERVVLISDSDQLPTLEVAECHFSRSMSCGIIAHANAIIERNTFSDLGWAGVSCSVDSRWLEGPLIANVLIRRNKFDRCGRFFGLSILVHTVVARGQRILEAAGTPMNHNISIQENCFEDSFRTVIFVGEVDNLHIRGNRFQNSRSTSDGIVSKDVIYLVDVKNASVVENSSTRSSVIVASKVEQVNFEVRDNVGLTLLFR